jgi:hypothetical protein
MLVSHVVEKANLRYITLAFLVAAAFAGVATAEDTDLGLYAYPNPFFLGVNEANLAYELPASGTVSVNVYDFEGNLVSTPVDSLRQTPGEHRGEISWDGLDRSYDYVKPGPYVIVLEVEIQGTTYRDTFVAIANR